MGILNYPQVSTWQDNLQSLGLSGHTFLGDNPKEPEEPSAAEELIKKQKMPDSHGEREDSPFGMSSIPNPMNNYGYKSKPGWLDFASLIPGGAGMAAKGINAGWNLNNAEAIDTARGTLGLEDKGNFLRDIMKDDEGHVADVSINNQDYSVGLEAEDPWGRTTLTPDEARKRSATLGGLEEKEPPKKESFFSSLFDDGPNRTENRTNFIDEATSFFDSLFDDSLNEFPDAPDQPKGAPDMTERTSRSDLSPGARDAMDRDSLGLY